MVEWASEAKYFVNSEFMLDDLGTLARGGRIPSSLATAGSVLDVKPLLSIDIDGRLSVVGMSRGRKKGMKALAEYYDRHSEENSEGSIVIIGHADCEKDAKRLREMIEKEHPEVIVVTTNIGPVIGCHVGPGMLGVCFWGKDRREALGVPDKIAAAVKRNK